ARRRRNLRAGCPRRWPERSAQARRSSFDKLRINSLAALKDGRGEGSAELPAELIGRLQAQRDEVRRPAGTDAPGVGAQRVRRRARDAVQRFRRGEPEELSAEVRYGLQIEARRRSGIVVARKRDDAAGL